MKDGARPLATASLVFGLLVAGCDGGLLDLLPLLGVDDLKLCRQCERPPKAPKTVHVEADWQELADALKNAGIGGARPEAVRVYLRDGAVFSMMHMHDAQFRRPNSGIGICLDDAQQEWLKAFKAAVKECISEADDEDLVCDTGKEPCPVLRVTGYASLAPQQPRDFTPCLGEPGKTFNCKVANLRARAVGAFLADDGKESHWKCPGEDGDFEGARTCAAEHCDGESRHLRMSDANGRSIGIVVDQWVSEIQMREGKPANDGSRPDNRRYRVEVNRAVHIEVRRDFCALPESLT